MGFVVGTPTSRIDALEKVLGSGKFAADIHLPGLLHGKLRLSDHAHARVLAIDASDAERLPGVKAVLTAWNAPDVRFGSDFQDQTLFARDKVLHRGHVLAVVAAIDPETAEEAVRRIRVRYEPLPAVTNVLEAIKPDAPILHDNLATYPGVNPGHICGALAAGVDPGDSTASGAGDRAPRRRRLRRQVANGPGTVLCVAGSAHRAASEDHPVARGGIFSGQAALSQRDSSENRRHVRWHTHGTPSAHVL